MESKSIVRLSNNKNSQLNILLNCNEKQLEDRIEQFLENHQMINLMCIKSRQLKNVKYTILRETNSKAWFFTTKNIFILHMPFSKYMEFHEYYKDSDEFKFLIYIRRKDNIIVDSNSDLIIFCVSHLITDENYHKFVEINKKWSKTSAYILSKRLGFFIPINRPYSDLVNKERSQLLGMFILGNGSNENENINNTINFILKWINCDKNNLPYHNLLLNK